MPIDVQELNEVIGSLTMLADGLAQDGQFRASGIVLAGRQALRVLRDHAFPAPPPAPPSEPKGKRKPGA
jgi:hypothetical protein